MFGDWFVCFDLSWNNTDYTFLKWISLALNSARKNCSHFANFEQSFHNYATVKGYCAFHKHANSKVHKPPSQLRFSLPSIIITITSNEPWNTETHKTDRNPPITNHKPWPFEPIKVKFCFLRGPLRWLTAGKNAIVGWLLNFTIHMFVKSAVNQHCFETTWSVRGDDQSLPFLVTLRTASVPFSVCNPNREDLQQVSSQVKQWRLSANKQSFWQTKV